MSLEVWEDALRAAAIVAVNPTECGGAVIRAGFGPVRDHWCSLVSGYLSGFSVMRRVPGHVTPDRLLGGLNLTDTLSLGRVIVDRGILASMQGGLLVVPMAERLVRATAAHLTAAMDQREVTVERDGISRKVACEFGVVALDEGIGEEEVTAALKERLAVVVRLDAVPPQWVNDFEAPYSLDDVRRARDLYPSVNPDLEVTEALCRASLALGIRSIRADILSLVVARMSAALEGRTEVQASDASLAARLVLAGRATRVPESPEQEQPPDSPTPDQPAPEQASSHDATEELLEDVLVEAAVSAIPQGLLSQLKADRQRRSRQLTQGPAGALRPSTARGRPAGVRAARSSKDERLNVIETLRAAAPWQRIRSRFVGERTSKVLVRKEDFRVTRYKQRSETLTIFCVDASGSAAFQRLAEAKGAVEQVLAECYSRRDNVALLSFRGDGADLILPPTRSLVRAKRTLAELPGGGPTPLAAAIDASLRVAQDAMRRGQSPTLVLMTDGRANIARDGAPSRSRAREDALESARAIGASGVRAILVDTAPRPRPEAQRLSDAMGAMYLALPYGQTTQVAGVVRGEATGTRPLRPSA